MIGIGIGFKRGDGVVFVRRTRDYVIGQPSTERDEITVGVVTSVTRDGRIKAYRDASHASVAPVKFEQSGNRYAASYVLPRDEVDMDGVADYCAARPWSHAPEHTGMPFHSLAEVRAELKQFKRKKALP